MSSRTRPGQHHTWPDNVQATPFGAPDMFGLGGARTQPAAMAEPVGAVAARVPKGVKGGLLGRGGRGGGGGGGGASKGDEGGGSGIFQMGVDGF